jgi:hypothetical protein
VSACVDSAKGSIARRVAIVTFAARAGEASALRFAEAGYRSPASTSTRRACGNGPARQSARRPADRSRGQDVPRQTATGAWSTTPSGRSLLHTNAPPRVTPAPGGGACRLGAAARRHAAQRVSRGQAGDSGAAPIAGAIVMTAGWGRARLHLATMNGVCVLCRSVAVGYERQHPHHDQSRARLDGDRRTPALGRLATARDRGTSPRSSPRRRRATSPAPTSSADGDGRRWPRDRPMRRGLLARPPSLATRSVGSRPRPPPPAERGKALRWSRAVIAETEIAATGYCVG